MKKNLTFLIAILTLGGVNAQNWQSLGPSDFNQPALGYTYESNFAIDPQGHLYIAFHDKEYSYMPTVRKFDGTTWEPVGPPGFSQTYSNLDIALAPDGTPYVTAYDLDTLARKFNGSRWEPVGSMVGEVYPEAIAIDSSGTPYLVTTGSGSFKATVFKFLDDTWQTVGDTAFTEERIHIIDFVIDPDGVPYVSYSLQHNGYQSRVMKLDGNSWVTVGSSGIPEGVGCSRLTLNDEGTPYLAFTDSLNGYRATVLMFNGNSWEPVGNAGFTPGFAIPDIALDPSGIPYVAFMDSTIGAKPRIMRFNGQTWETTGNAGFSDLQTDRVTILTDPVGTLYVAYEDRYTSIDDNLYKARVMKLNGNTWESVGSAGISGGVDSPGSFAVDPSGTPYLAYYFDSYFSPLMDESWHKTKIVRWKDNAWEKVGTADYFKGVNNVSLAISPDGTPYMAYNDSINGYKASLIRFNGNDWETVGNAGFSQGEVSSPSLAIDNTGTPYMAYSDNTNENKATVMKFNGSEWETVGMAGFSEGSHRHMIALDKEDTPYVLYSSYAANNYRVTVRKWNGSNWESLGDADISEGEAYPFFISIDDAGSPYIAWFDYIIYQVVIKKLNGNTWESIPTPVSLTTSTASFALDPDGTLYVAFSDQANENKATVFRLNGSTWEPVGTRGFSASRAYPDLAIDQSGNLHVVYSTAGLWAYQYESDLVNPTAPELTQSKPSVKAWPNPFTDKLTIEFISRTTTRARLEIFDAAGVQLAVPFDSPVMEGQLYQADYFPDRKSSQMLVYRLSMADQQYVGKLIFQEKK